MDSGWLIGNVFKITNNYIFQDCSFIYFKHKTRVRCHLEYLNLDLITGQDL